MCGGVGGWLPLGDKYARVPCGGGGGCAATGPAPARLSDTAFFVQAQGRVVRWQIRAIVRGSVYRPPHVRPCHRATLPKGVKVVYVLPDTIGWAHEPPMCGGVGGWRPLGEKYARVPCGGGGGSAATGPAPARLSDTAFLVQALMYDDAQWDDAFPQGYLPGGVDLQSVLVDGAEADWGFQVLMDNLPSTHKARWFAGAALNTSEQGMAAALTAARQGHQVVLAERQARVGRKLLSTGNGRCNLTNEYALPDRYHGEEPGRPMLPCT